MPVRLNAAEIEKRRALYEDSSLSVAEAAARAGCGVSTIYSYALRCGWKKRAERHAPRLSRAEIRALYEEGLVPVGEIARIARLAEHTIYVYAAREGWKPRASRLRARSAASDEIADVAAEVAAARRRAEQESAWRSARLLEKAAHELARVVMTKERLKQRAKKAREREHAKWRRRLNHAPDQLAAMGIDPRPPSKRG